MGPSELILLPRSSPRNKEELLALLPDKIVMDRLMNRYFNSNSPSQRMCSTKAASDSGRRNLVY